MTYDARPVNSFSNSHRVTRFLLPALPESTAAEPFRILGRRHPHHPLR